MVWKTVDRKIVGSIGIGATEEEAPTPPEEPYVPPYVPPYEPPPVIEAPERREEVTRSQFYSAHERILKELRKAGDKGMCLTDKELATITGIDIESVLEHRQILELDEAVKTVQTVENPVVCHVDRLARTLRKLREK